MQEETAALTDCLSALPAFKPGFYGQGRIVAKDAVEQWAGMSPFKGNEQQVAMEAAHVAQAELAEVGQKIVDALTAHIAELRTRCC